VLTALTAMAAGTVPAQAQYGSGPAGGTSPQCLSNELKETIRKKVESARKTTVGEKEDPLDPDYFVGTWKMEWVATDSPLGSSGDVTGTLTIRHVEGCYYEGALQAMGPDGPYTSTLRILYNLEHRFLAWIEDDSRGFEMVQVGPVGGDLRLLHALLGTAGHQGQGDERPSSGDDIRPDADHVFGPPANLGGWRSLHELWNSLVFPANGGGLG
jgi:hypothetical protein